MASLQKLWRIQHRTFYRYASPARESFNETRLKPLNDAHQTVRSFHLTVQPNAPVHDYLDFCGNVVHHFDINEAHEKLLIETRSLVAVHPKAALAAEADSVRLADLAGHIPEVECYDYMGGSRFVELEPELWRLAVDATIGCERVWPAVLAILRFVHGWMRYTPLATHVHTTVREAMAKREGVCQDFAHLMIGLCRSLKIPARYVSGYLATEQVRATHAWVEVYLPGVGWYALDPTHNQALDGCYVRIGAGRDYGDVAPVTGYYNGTRERVMEVEVAIEAAE